MKLYDVMRKEALSFIEMRVVRGVHGNMMSDGIDTAASQWERRTSAYVLANADRRTVGLWLGPREPPRKKVEKPTEY
jgi:hypothetical protein